MVSALGKTTIKPASTVYIVDGDSGIRDIIGRLARGIGLDVLEFPSGGQFLCSDTRNLKGCLVMDSWLPDMNGLNLYKQLLEQDVILPTIMTSTCADIRLAVQAMKLGVLDFLEKPFQNSELLERIREGLDMDMARRKEIQTVSELGTRIQRLTDREKQVLTLLIEGLQNKQIAKTLGISPRTVETHRARVMEKLELRSLGTLIMRPVLQMLEPNSVPDLWGFSTQTEKRRSWTG